MSFIVDKKTNELSGKTCKCKENLRLRKSLEFASIPDEFADLTIASFDIQLYQSDIAKERALRAKQAAINFIRNFKDFQDKGKGLYIYSTAKGSGKTRLAASIGNALINMNKCSVKFTNTIKLLNEIKKSFNKDKQYNYDLIDAITNVPVLILDDIGVEKQSAWVNEVFYSIIDSRMTANKVTIFTSNIRIEELKYDERISSRIEKMAIPVYLPEEYIRSKLAKKENEQFMVLLLK